MTVGYLGFDTETTGVDRNHGASPYFVTSCNEQWENTYWEWEVDPLTRKVNAPRNDVIEIAETIEAAEGLVFQNPKFDVSMLMPSLEEVGFTEWPWFKTWDTLFAGHLLASNHAKDLTSMLIEYCAIDITKFEDALEIAVKACHAIVRRTGSPIGDWRIAKKGLEEMPSAKEKTWKFDSWLPRAVAKRKIPGWEPSWLTVAQGYANPDSAGVLGLFLTQRRLLKERELWEIYLERLKLLPVITGMERRGITANRKRLKGLEEKFTRSGEEAHTRCKAIAASYDDYQLVLPKAGNNKSLTTFMFDILKVKPVYDRKSKTGNPTLNKDAMTEYKNTLPKRSKALTFVLALGEKRSADTSLSYMKGYEKFWIPLDLWNDKGERLWKRGEVSLDEIEWFVLYPSLNPTGTDTLRFSSSNPNEQNISKKEGFNLRFIFGPAPGREWWSCDAQNIELRIPAYEAEEPDMIALFEKPSEPPYYGSNHLLNFHTVYPDIWDEGVKAVGEDLVGRWLKTDRPDWHKRVKNGGFAVQYGAMERTDRDGTADLAFGRSGCHAKLKQRFAKIHGPGGLNEHYIKYAERHGYVETLVDKSIGAKRGYPLLCTRSSFGKILPTVPFNYHIQGTACWWMCKAMTRCQDQLDTWRKEEGFEGYIAMQVHDELVFDLPAGSGPDFYRTNLPRIRKLVDLMKMGGDDIGIPTAVNCEYHRDNWAEGKPIYLAKEPV